ncbi:MAG: putative transrane protein [Rhizorhabdus sp.]|nr:putative transrane protein [Rhizorhabdus sp.]
MSPDIVLAGLLAFAVLLGTGRLLLWQYRLPADQHVRGWRLAVLLILQPICAGLLYCTFLPPRVAGASGTIIVATRNTPRLAVLGTGDHVVALPEAPSLPGAERMPDLATALRRYPGTQRLRIAGEGLEARDRDAIAGLGVAFEPLPLPRGLVRLDAPASVAPGAAFRVGASVNNVAGGTAELLDPAGRRVDAHGLSATGDVVLGGAARGPGVALFRLRIRDAARMPIEDVDVPVAAMIEPAPRILLLAAAPNPEVKYLRRWAADAGLMLRAQFGAGGGVQLGDPPLPLNASTFQRLDLVILDDRSWAVLGAGERAALIEAVRGGLGLLVRITGPVPDATRRQWQGLGLSISAGADTASFRLAPEAIDADAARARRGIGTRDSPLAAGEEETVLTRRAIAIVAADGASLLRDTASIPLAIWRAEGRGRIGVTTIVDSFALALSGQGDRHAELWSDIAMTLSRAQSGLPPRIDPQPRAGQRVTLCGLGAAPRVIAPGAKATPLLFGPASCAGYWPSRAGWHMLTAGERTWPFFVRPVDAAPGLRAAENREATLRLVAEPAAGGAAAAGQRGVSWPWFLAWLAVSGALWWFERSRLGRSYSSPERGGTSTSAFRTAVETDRP